MSLSKEQAQARVKELEALLDNTYAELSNLAVEHKLYVSIEGPAYGMGGWVNTEEGNERWGEEVAIGEWQASANSC